MSFGCHLYALIFVSMYSYVTRMSLVCTRISSVCPSYVLVYHPYVTRMYSYAIRMSLVCTRMSSVYHSYVLVCHPYVTRMYSYVIRMSLVCHPYVTRMYSYVICMLLVCGFTMNHYHKIKQTYICKCLHQETVNIAALNGNHI